MEVKKPLLKRKLFISNNAYYLERPQKKGEEDLARIAKKADRENIWTFYEDTGFWLHLPNEHNEEKFNDGSLLLECISSAVYESVLGKKGINYHIHPDLMLNHAMSKVNYKESNSCKNLIKTVLYSWCSMPSNSDIEIIKGVGIGYQHKIVTTKGVTSMMCNPHIIPVEVNNPEQFFKDCVDISVIAKQGLEAGIKDALSKVNEKYQGYIHSTYHLH